MGISDRERKKGCGAWVRIKEVGTAGEGGNKTERVGECEG